MPTCMCYPRFEVYPLLRRGSRSDSRSSSPSTLTSSVSSEEISDPDSSSPTMYFGLDEAGRIVRVTSLDQLYEMRWVDDEVIEITMVSSFPQTNIVLLSLNSVIQETWDDWSWNGSRILGKSSSKVSSGFDCSQPSFRTWKKETLITSNDTTSMIAWDATSHYISFTLLSIVSYWILTPNQRHFANSNDDSHLFSFSNNRTNLFEFDNENRVKRMSDKKEKCQSVKYNETNQQKLLKGLDQRSNWNIDLSEW